MLINKGYNLKKHHGTIDFFNYWDSLGFFDDVQTFIPPQFFVLFEIARTIFTEDTKIDAYDAIEEISNEEIFIKTNREESIQVNRLEKIAPVSDKMEIDNYKNINELKKALPRELAQDDDVFNVKLFTKSLIVQKFYETEADSFKPISTSRNEKGKDANRFEQKFYLLLDRSKSMEKNMRTFFSKCVAAEFLRRKMNSNAKIFYRPFDSKAGSLFKIEKKEDFPVLIERILLTTTGGRSTNIQLAVEQAVKDINYDKEMLKAEILIITDGISKINKNELKNKLGDIKLNVLKIGDELAEPDFFEIEQSFKKENIKFDPAALNIKQVQNELHKSKAQGDDSSISFNKRRTLQIIQDTSEKMFKDLKDISRKYIEIQDLESDDFFEVSDEKISYIKKSIEKLDKAPLDKFTHTEKIRVFKQVNFLGQYVQMLIANGKTNIDTLKNLHEKITAVKQKYLKDPDLLITFTQAKTLDSDKKLMKLARKDLKRLKKDMEFDQKKLGIKDLKKAQLTFTMDVGEGNIGQLLLLFIIKFLQLIKNILLFPISIFRKKKKN